MPQSEGVCWTSGRAYRSLSFLAHDFFAGWSELPWRLGEPMGAWGHGSFENDDAADWVHEFELQGASAVVSALEYISRFPEEEYLEAPGASVAIAAAEIVAAARDSDLS